MKQENDIMIVEGIMSKDDNRRYVVINLATGDTLVDANGRGYKTKREAMDAYNESLKIEDEYPARPDSVQSANGRDEKSVSLPNVLIYIDVACGGNPGPGGYAFVVVKDSEVVTKMSGGSSLITCNRMELFALTLALETIDEPSNVQVFSHNKYITDCITQGTARAFQKNGWKTQKGVAIGHSDLWEKLLRLDDEIKPRYTWTEDRAGNEYFKMCDMRSIDVAFRFR